MDKNIHSFNINPQLLHRFNAAAWSEHNTSNTFLMAREVKFAAAKGQPDKGDMVLLKLNEQGEVVSERTIWRPDNSKTLLEDPRVLISKNDKMHLGLSAVEQSGNFDPYPAISIFENSQYITDNLPEVKILTEFGPGKNTTPVDEEGTFFFRQDGEQNHHKLLAFYYDGQKSKKLGQIDFPTNIPWALWKIGTTMPPIWQNPHEALMIIHGITIKDGKFIYSLGRAKLIRKASSNQFTIDVDPKPILTPDDFLDSSGKPLVEELHPAIRRVVYACGGVMKKVQSRLTLALYVNVGDRQTIEVQIPWKNLIQNWWIN